MLRQSGLFAATFYASAAPDLPQGADLLAHYHDQGWREGRWPNAYFDPAWYIATNVDVAALNTDPLLHYVSYGEREGRRPIAWFDPGWYRTRHSAPDTIHCLAHFLTHRFSGEVSPIAEFDAAWYCATYPDVAAAGVDPFEHYRVQGFREARDPSPDFDTRYYRQRHLRGQPEQNPLLHFLAHRSEPGIHPRLPEGETTTAREVERFSAPGPLFEPVAALSDEAPRRATVLAYYLPQFHATPHNDKWWGEGFTEWRNVARGLPRFANHYQPRIPRDLGHYSLNDPAVMRRQIGLAKGAGLAGFVFHFYWFDRLRLLERPVERFLADPTLDFSFCLMWANENWTRRWDGSDEEVLVAQHYAEADEPALIDCFARHFKDSRYIRLNGRPLLMIYRPGLIPQVAATVRRWREQFRDVHGENPILVMAQSFGDSDPRPFGIDGATEFPPHKLLADVPPLTEALDLLDERFSAQVYDYAELARAACAMHAPDFPLIRATIPSWDNDARRQGQGMVVHGATPAVYEAWLTHLVRQAALRPFFGTPLVCINAWNEWAEGAYLEPDQHFGAAFLNATGRAIAGVTSGQATGRVLLVGHDAFPAGAQLLLLHIARQLRAAHGVELDIVLGGAGALLPQFAELAPTKVVGNAEELAAHLRSRHSPRAIVNSAASAWCCQTLRAENVATTLLVHEMPALLRERGALNSLRSAIDAGITVIYPAEAVRTALSPLLNASPSLILPQGVYRPLVAAPGAALSLRRQWGIGRTDPLVIGMGYGDRRKGFDLFLSVWQAASTTHPALHMAWVGSVEPGLHTTLAAQIAAAEATGRFRLVGWRDDIAAVLAASDMLISTSREDPYPSAVLEALCAGVEVVAFADSGGIPDLLTRTGAGRVVPPDDCAAMAACLPRGRRRRRPHQAVAETHRFDRYVSAVLTAAWPDRPRISVIVPCYRQAAMLPRRLHSIFAQSMPIDEIVLYDDASDDDSVVVARRLAAQAGRTLTIVQAGSNSGSPFSVWPAAVARATGDLIWIAEGDDSAEPDFLARLGQTLAAPDMLLAFCDSTPIDAAGRPADAEYRSSYAAAGGAQALGQDAVFDAADFAERFLAERNILFSVSAVLWRRTALHDALQRLGDDLLAWRVAGDWRLYLEALTATPGLIGHVAAPLNHHCLHPASASATLDTARHLDEIRRMQQIAMHRFGQPAGLAARQDRYFAEAALHLGAPR